MPLVLLPSHAQLAQGCRVSAEIYNLLRRASTHHKHFVVIQISNVSGGHAPRNPAINYVLSKASGSCANDNLSRNLSSSRISLHLNWSLVMGTLYTKGRKDFYRHSGQPCWSWVDTHTHTHRRGSNVPPMMENWKRSLSFSPKMRKWSSNNRHRPEKQRTSTGVWQWCSKSHHDLHHW